MKEIVYRRYKRLTEEGESLPQLIVIDGSKRQLGPPLESLKSWASMDKGGHMLRAKRLEEIYFPEDPLPLYINKNLKSLH